MAVRKNISIIISSFPLQGWARVAFNMQWGNFKAILTVLRVVEMNQMHRNIFYAT